MIGSNVFNLATLLGLPAVVAEWIGFHRRMMVITVEQGAVRPAAAILAAARDKAAICSNTMAKAATPSWRPTLQVVLIDELAHTNIPGSRNAKRWQDIEEILAAGITVISNVNIQHMESLNDVVQQITGVAQRETVAR